MRRSLLCVVILSLAVITVAKSRAERDSKAWWDANVEKALVQADANRPEMEKALHGVPAEQRKAIAFLIANMPRADLRALKADFLLENVSLACTARKQLPWGEKIPEEIFLNDVLPYANVDEARHPWRKELYELCLPLVKDCKTPAEAAQTLNSTLFARLKVKYSTQRRLPNQSPKESIEQGLASCTGLSIILSDACRSVCVPARLVGTPLWSNMRGNHTWVEIWDGDWHFTGACEADPQGLDRGWFVGEAAKAQKDKPRHAIYATSFRKTATHFPLVWAPASKEVPAENVTDRYTSTRAPAEKPKVTAEQLQQIEKEAAAFFTASDEEREKWSAPEKFDQWLADDDAAVRQAVWKAYQAAPIHARMKKDFEDKMVRWKDHVSQYTVKQVGKRPEKGWPLVIAMHGGGGAPKQVNDQQWRQMQVYYRDQDSVTGYQYLALRAPNDVWNGFYDDYVPPLVSNLIRQFALFGDIDTDRVYLIGYSHGGYGAFFVGPKIPDRFAAVHSSAAAPTDGTISPLSLRNTRFTFMVGEKDTAYGRRERCEKFAETIKKLKEQDKDDFPVEFELKAGFGHGGLPDRDKIKDLYPHTRNAVPRRLTWEPMDAHITDFFWLSVPQPAKGQSLDVTLRDNTAQITTKNVKQLVLNLDARLPNFAKPLTLTLDGQTRKLTLRPRFTTLCQSMMRRGDPGLAYTCQVVLDVEKK